MICHFPDEHYCQDCETCAKDMPRPRLGYFGLPSPGNSWLDEAERVERPVGVACAFCGKEIVMNDSGYKTLDGDVLHNDCFFLSVVGIAL